MSKCEVDGFVEDTMMGVISHPGWQFAFILQISSIYNQSKKQ